MSYCVLFLTDVELFLLYFKFFIISLYLTWKVVMVTTL
jgi:hypothetical protein